MTERWSRVKEPFAEGAALPKPDLLAREIAKCDAALGGAAGGPTAVHRRID